jgi:YVTN family beta-propeller protein
MIFSVSIKTKYLLLLSAILGCSSVTARYVPTPPPSYAYVANNASNTLSVINLSNNQFHSNITVGKNPQGMAVSYSDSPYSNPYFVCVANTGDNTISYINTTSNTVVATVTNALINYGYNVLNQPISIALGFGPVLIVVNNISGGFNPNILILSADPTSLGFRETPLLGSTAINAKPVLVLTAPIPISISSGAYDAFYVLFDDNTLRKYSYTFGYIITEVNSASLPSGNTNPKYAAFTPNGQYIYVVNTNSGAGTINVYDIATDAFLPDTFNVSGGGPGGGIAMQGNYAYITSGSLSNPNLTIINTATISDAGTASIGDGYGSIAINSVTTKGITVNTAYIANPSFTNQNYIGLSTISSGTSFSSVQSLSTPVSDPISIVLAPVMLSSPGSCKGFIKQITPANPKLRMF